MVQTSATREGTHLAGAQSNQRATMRYRCGPATPGRLLQADDQEYQRGWILNMSVTGLGLQLARKVVTGAKTMILMTGASSQKNYELASNIAHCTQQANGDWVVGLMFIQPLSSEELDDLLS